MKHFLVTRPTHDKRTHYIHSFAKGIVAITKSDPTIQLTDLQGPKATRKKVESVMKRTNPRLVYLNGHGDPETICGHKDEPILDKKNVDITKGKIIYALSCESLLELGDAAINAGADAFIGYEAAFMWHANPSRVASPDKDKSAAPFRKVCHVLIYSLISGVDVKTTIERTQEAYKKLIKTYGNSKDDPFGDAPLIGLALGWDLSCLGWKGNPTARF